MTVTRAQLADDYPDLELLFLDGFDAALIGACMRFGQEPVALYDRRKIIELIVQDSTCPADLDYECEDGAACDACYHAAEEYFEFNVIGAWVGDATPAFADLPTAERRSWVTAEETLKQIDAFYNDYEGPKP